MATLNTSTTAPSRNAGSADDSFGVWLDNIISDPMGSPSGHYWGSQRHAKRVEDAIFDLERLRLLASRTSANLKRAGVKSRRMVQPKIGIPLLEAATMEYDEGLHALWAGLLASAMDPNQDPVERRFVSILAELSSHDAWLLEQILFEWMTAESDNFGAPLVKAGSNGDGVALAGLAAHNLGRLGLIEADAIETATSRSMTEPDRAQPPSSAPLAMTAFGAAFARALGMPRLRQA